jgi:hypothetical protein
VLVALSGMHTDQRQAAAKQLGKLRLKHSTESNAWKAGTTHLLSAGLTRTDKALCTMAAGGWLLKDGCAAGSLRPGLACCWCLDMLPACSGWLAAPGPGCPIN